MTAIFVWIIAALESIRCSAGGAGNEYCPGFIDRHGQWNNGFECPKWGDPGQTYCCGTEMLRFCCPVFPSTPLPDPRNTQTTQSANLRHHVFLWLFVVGTVVLLTATVVIMCFYCRCCFIYRRRKLRRDISADPNAVGYLNRRQTDGFDFDLNLASRGNLEQEFIALRPPLYPEYDPPAYEDIAENGREQPTSKQKRRAKKSPSDPETSTFIRNEAVPTDQPTQLLQRSEKPKQNSASSLGLLRRSNVESSSLSCHSNATNDGDVSGPSSASTANIRRCHGNGCSSSAYQPVSMVPDTVEATRDFSQFSLSIR